ncbi:MAG: hypothetical protein EOP01_00310 [Propionibacteriaceae bacterium]|nr:MAG: hypothetical protein EOP01_00310 [Propionibacteriaceae bacterium]
MVDGVSAGLDVGELRRNHMLGNAVCPQQARFAFEALAGLRPYPSRVRAGTKRARAHRETYPDLGRFLRTFLPRAESCRGRDDYPDLTRLLRSFLDRRAPGGDGGPPELPAGQGGFFLAAAQ